MTPHALLLQYRETRANHGTRVVGEEDGRNAENEFERAISGGECMRR